MYFTIWHPSDMFHVQNLSIGCIIFLKVPICFTILNLIKIGLVLTELTIYNDVQDGGRMQFWIFEFWNLFLLSFAFPHIILRKLGNPLSSYGQNCIFQYGVRPPSWIKKFWHFDAKFNIHQLILVIFGRDVAVRVCYRMVICYIPPLLTNVSALPVETWTRKLSFQPCCVPCL